MGKCSVVTRGMTFVAEIVTLQLEKSPLLAFGHFLLITFSQPLTEWYREWIRMSMFRTKYMLPNSIELSLGGVSQRRLASRVRSNAN